MGGSPKNLVQHLAGETSLLGTTGVQLWLPGLSDIRERGNGHGRAQWISTTDGTNITTIHTVRRLQEQVIRGAHEAKVILRQFLPRGRK